MTDATGEGMSLDEFRAQYQEDMPLPWTVASKLKPKRTTTLLCADGSGLHIPGGGLITNAMLSNLVNVYNAVPALLAQLDAYAALEEVAARVESLLNWRGEDDLGRRGKRSIQDLNAALSAVRAAREGA